MYMILCYYLQLQTLINNILFLLHMTILIAVRIPQQASTTTKVKGVYKNFLKNRQKLENSEKSEKAGKHFLICQCWCSDLKTGCG